MVSGKAFAHQPVAATSIRSQDVLIGGRPLVNLGGDFWYTPYPIGQNGDHLVRVVTKGAGILESAVFTIAKRFIAFRLGGSAGGGVAIELRVPAKTAKALGLKARDKPDAGGYVAVNVTAPSGSDVLREQVWDLAPKGSANRLVGATAKIRLRMNATGQSQRLLVDWVRMLPKPPSPSHPPLWGWADIHCHPMAQAGFGDVLAGHMHGPVEDLGSCLPLHGGMHNNLLRPVAFALENGRFNDGSLATSGSTTGTPGPDEELGFRGWPAFDEITHIKTHQDWIRRAYEGGQRLMVALIVHNQMLASLSTVTRGIFEAQSDRDTVEPQVQMLREFVAHNGDWCGIATTPGEARTLIEQNKMAFVLGLETDSINDWVRNADLPQTDTPAGRADIHMAIHDYFDYLHKLGVVQINLIHLSDNAFGGMALYDVMFVVNSWQRRGILPTTEDGFKPHTNPDEAIATPVTLESALWEKLAPKAQQLGITPPPPPGNGVYGHGDRNANGLTTAGEEAVLEAMRLGMVIDMDHMSEHSIDGAFDLATKHVPGVVYPLVAAHNGARRLARRPPAQLPTPTAVPGGAERRNPHTWPSESMKSETHLERIKATGGMFGHGIAGSDSQAFGAVPNDCPGTSKTVAQGLEYVTTRLEMPVALGTDWNALLPGPGPRFGPLAATGVLGELDPPNDMWSAAVRGERFADANIQTNGVLYDTPIADWRCYRFSASDPETELYRDQAWHGEGQFIWQAHALRESSVDLTQADVRTALHEPALGAAPALDIALGLTGGADTGSDWYNAGAIVRSPTTPVTGDPTHVQNLVDGINAIGVLWSRMRSGNTPKMHRSTAGPMRDFDYNIDGLSHYGMLPDMLQDLKNVGLPDPVLAQFFRSAERYVQVWERSVAAGAAIPHP